MERGTVIIQSFLAFVRILDGRGLDTDSLLKSVGLSREALTDMDRRVPMASLYDMYEHAIRELDDPALPMTIAAGVTLTDLHIMGFAIETSPTAKEALRRAIRYHRLSFDTGHEWELVEHGNDLTIRYNAPMPSRLGLRIACEIALAQFVLHFREMIRVENVCQRVNIPHAKPRDDSAHRALFRCQPHYGDGECSFTFARELLDRKVTPVGDARHQEFFRRYAEELLLELPVQSTVTDMCRHAVQRALATGEPNAESIARSLGMSARGLRRELAGEDTSFRIIVDGVRESRARALLESREASITDVAFLLGFGDASAFSRAFKRWTGRSPRDFRKALG